MENENNNRLYETTDDEIRDFYPDVRVACTKWLRARGLIQNMKDFGNLPFPKTNNEFKTQPSLGIEA
jgi:hypothetical protein